MEAYELNLLEHQNEACSVCNNFLLKHNIKMIAIDDILKEIGKSEFSPFTIADRIYSQKTLTAVTGWSGRFMEAIIEAEKKRWEKEIAKAKEENKPEEPRDENSDKLEEEMKKTSDSLKELAEKIEKNKKVDKERIDRINKEKNERKRSESDKKQPDSNPNLPTKGDSFDEKSKKKYTQEAERELRKHNISDAKLSQRLGISDWRVEMNKSTDWNSAQSFWFNIQDAIKEISQAIVCDYCKETKSPLLGKDAYVIPSKKKKFCSWDCKNAWEEDNKDKKDDDKKDSSNKGNKFQNFDINEFFAWMKRMGVGELKFDFDNNQVVIKLKNGKQLDIKESGLSAKQQEDLTKQLKSTSEPITFSEVESKFNKKGNNDNKSGKAGIIAAVIVVGLILAVIIGVVIGKNKKKGY